jgi:ubiquinone/menaquinone biosynthesis C-methylase UbiE
MKYFLKTAKNEDHVVLESAIFLPFKDKYFDVSFAIEIIEHLKKEDGYKLISEMERVTKSH